MNQPQKCNHSLKRRDFIKVGVVTYLGLSLSQLLELEALYGAPDAPAQSVILLWMDGGPSHLDSFDPKPEAGQEIRGEFGVVETKIKGIYFGELLPQLAQQMDKLALIRSFSHDEGAHERAAHLTLTGWKPLPSLVYPSMGSVVAKELDPGGPLPPYIAIPGSGFGFGYGQAGYLAAAFNPFSVGGDPNNPHFSVRDVALPNGLTLERLDRRRTLLQAVDALFKQFEKSPEIVSRNTFYERAYNMISSPEAKKAFNIQSEPDKVRDRYGRHTFGQSCLLARRLVEAGVRFITVSIGGWDTHSDNFKQMRNLLPQIDQGFSALIEDLHQRGLLEKTLVLWLGEFGRTPKVNALAGRDHWPDAQTVVIAGGGVPGGQVIGQTDKTGGTPTDRRIRPADLVATVYKKLGIDWGKTYETPQQRPVKILDGGEPIKELLS